MGLGKVVKMTKSLTEIANIYGTDKGTIGPSDDWSGNNYTDIFEAYLEKYRDSELNVFEIGLGVKGDYWEAKIVQGRNLGGASLKMWYDYFPNAKIFGIDVNECSYLDNDRITTCVADQGNVDDLENFKKITEPSMFDFIFDDGSHRPDDQQTALSYFFSYLKPGGLYFIENLFSNGLGDGTKGRMASDKIKNTRSVLKHFQKFGIFLEPNGLTNQTYLAENIDSINFHCPQVLVKFKFRANPLYPIKRVISYTPGTETLCAIRKK